MVAPVYDHRRGHEVFVNVSKGATRYAHPSQPTPTDELTIPVQLVRTRLGSGQGAYSDTQCGWCGLLNWHWRQTCRHCGLDQHGQAGPLEWDDFLCNWCLQDNWHWRRTCRRCHNDADGTDRRRY